MGASEKISISLPRNLLRDVEVRRAESRETRSDFFRRAAEFLLQREREREAVERYIRGYVEHPEQEAEQAWAELGEARFTEGEW